LSASAAPDDYRASVERHHAARVARLRSATGWLSLVGKSFLGQGTTTVGSSSDSDARLPDGAPPHVGSLHVEGHVVRFEAHPDAVATFDGEPVTSRVLRSDRGGRADAIVVSGFVLEVMERGDTLALRIRDTRELPRPYGGIDYYPLDPSLNVRATLLRHPEPRTVDLDFEGATGAVMDSFVSPGVVVFERLGEHRLEAVYEDSSQRRLFILFRDATSGPESYGLGRFLYAPLPASSDDVMLDFNMSMLPGCAFTVFATCPIPPRENRLAIPIRAGERAYLAKPIGE
jgi:uncharacterized protein (DUF1684 family)